LQREQQRCKLGMLGFLSRPSWRWTTWGTGTYRQNWRKDIFPSLKSALLWYSRNCQLDVIWFAVAEHHADGEVLHSHFLLSERNSLLRLWDVRMQLASFYQKKYGRIQLEPYLPKKYPKLSLETYLSKYILKQVRFSSGLSWDLGCISNGKPVEFSEVDADLSG